MNKVLIVIDPQTPVLALELLEAAAKIANGCIASYAFCFGKCAPCIDGHFDYCLFTDAPIAPHDTLNAAMYIERLHAQYHFNAILFPATTWGRQLAPRTAMEIGAGLVADITAIDCEGGCVRLVRPAFDGKLLAVIECVGEGPLMASVRSGVFRYVGEGRKDTKLIAFTPESPLPSGISLLSIEPKPPSADIRECKILVSGGGGVEETFEALAPLAKALDGQVSASRRLVDSGIATRAIQVGQTGKTVSPQVYFAIGIHGALQHIEGLRGVGCVISVNTNRNAPICSISDVVVEGDGAAFARKLAQRINRSNMED